MVPGQSGKLLKVIPVRAKRLGEGPLDRLDGLEDPVGQWLAEFLELVLYGIELRAVGRF